MLLHRCATIASRRGFATLSPARLRSSLVWPVVNASLSSLPSASAPTFTTTPLETHCVHRKADIHDPISRFANQVERTREAHTQQAANVTSELAPKRPRDSLLEVSLPFATDEKLRHSFVSANGFVRFGSLLEEMDLLAGRVAYRHSDGFNPARPLVIVTAACDRISLSTTTRELDIQTNMRLLGRTTWVGRTSMEVAVERMTARVDSSALSALPRPRISIRALSVCWFGWRRSGTRSGPARK